MMKDSFPDWDPVEEAAAARWYLEEHLERMPRCPAASPSGMDITCASEDFPDDVLAAARRSQNRFGHFILLEQIGAGSTGAVFRAWDTRWSQLAAVKLLHSMEPTVLERFIAEAPRASYLKQASIATPYEAGEHEGQWYVAMTYIDGRPIDAEARPLTLTLEFVRDACRAVDEAHLQGVAHGSLTARNLLVNRLDRVYVTGFGVPNRLVPSDVAGDIYDLGILLRKLVQGHPEVSPELEDAIARAAAVHPGDRFPSAGAMADELDRLLLARRYSGTFGLPRRLARKWGPVAVAAATLAAIGGWILPGFLSKASGHVSPDLKSHYKQAAMALLRIEESDEVADSGPRAERLRGFFNTHMTPLLERNPRSLHARVLKARAIYLEGGGEAASRELEGLREYEALDYRVRYLQVLIELEKSLAKPLPLPAPEAPGPDWNGGVPDWRGYHGDLAAVARLSMQPDSLLFAEHRRDVEAAQALLLLVEGQWRPASEKLTLLIQTQKLPVYLAARRAAAYLARRFDEVLDEPGTQFALALDSSHSPSDDVKRLQPLLAGDPNREGTLYCWAARRCLAQGIDPRPHVEAAMRRTLDSESRAILEVAHLRWRGDDESGYRNIAAKLGESSTWMGRIARIEALIGAGRHLHRGGGNATELFHEALSRTDDLPAGDRWNVPRLLRAEALLGLDRCAEALDEVKLVRGVPTDAFRSLLIASAATLRLADQARRAGSRSESTFLDASIASSERALVLFPTHPEAITLRAAAAIFAAERRRDSESLQDAIDRLNEVLNSRPDHLEARYHRASARFLHGSRADALEDLDRILAAAPDFVAARVLRAAVRASMGADQSVVDDLKEALQAEQCPDREEVQRWLGIIESRK